MYLAWLDPKPLVHQLTALPTELPELPVETFNEINESFQNLIYVLLESAFMCVCARAYGLLGACNCCCLVRQESIFIFQCQSVGYTSFFVCRQLLTARNAENEPTAFDARKHGLVQLTTAPPEYRVHILAVSLKQKVQNITSSLQVLY